MKMDWSFLKTRVARRIFLLFFVCALVPILIAAGYSYWRVSRELNEQSRERVTQTLRATDGAIFERLLFLNAQLDGLAATLPDRPDLRGPLGPEDVDTLLTRRFIGGGVMSNSGLLPPLFGTLATPPPVTEADRRFMGSGRPLLTTSGDSTNPLIFMGRLVIPEIPNGAILWGQLSPIYLFAAGEDHPALPADMEICVFDHADRPLYCPVEHAAPLGEQLTVTTAARATTPEDRGEFGWGDAGEEYAAGYKTIFLRTQYGSEGWILVLSESKDTVLQPMSEFRKSFPFAILLVVLVVLAVSNFQIKKSMDPLLSLRDGTRRIAKRDFDTPVEVTSGDEFEDLATSFNSMAGRLRSQFNTLTALNEIDHVVLSAQDIDEIIDTVLSGTRRVLPCDGLSVSVLSGTGARAKWRLVAVASRDDEQIRHDIEISDEEEVELRANQNHLVVQGGPGSRSYLVISPFTTGGISSFLVLPIFLKGDLSAVIALGYVSRPAFGEDDLNQARQMADQVAVALSNTRLIDELDALNVGALTALARTIDAKSPWTAGHSERVTTTSLKVARQMGLGDDELERINRGGLLHDIGKIGIPADILDKPAALNEEEMQVMRDHVTVGARILEPIAAYADVIPIVLRHHERWDGSGYPDGLAGENIDFLARLLAAGDVYDALTSHRPYRTGMPHAEAVGWVAEQSGTHFDPKVVTAFLDVMADPNETAADAASPVYRPAVSLSEPGR
jgi:putative nucleotidyltransferase with HDIG domain